MHDHENAYISKLESSKSLEEITLENEENLSQDKLGILIAALITKYCGSIEGDIFPTELSNIDNINEKLDYVLNLFDSLPVVCFFFLYFIKFLTFLI